MAGLCVSGLLAGLLAGLVAGGLGRLGAPPCCFASCGGFTGLALPNDCPALDWPAFDWPNFDFATSALAVLELPPSSRGISGVFSWPTWFLWSRGRRREVYQTRGDDGRSRRGPSRLPALPEARVIDPVFDVVVRALCYRTRVRHFIHRYCCNGHECVNVVKIVKAVKIVMER